MSRIIGLFVGAVLLAIGYQIFMEWIDNGDEGADSEPAESDPGATCNLAGDPSRTRNQ